MRESEKMLVGFVKLKAKTETLVDAHRDQVPSYGRKDLLKGKGKSVKIHRTLEVTWRCAVGRVDLI